MKCAPFGCNPLLFVAIFLLFFYYLRVYKKSLFVTVCLYCCGTVTSAAGRFFFFFFSWQDNAQYRHSRRETNNSTEVRQVGKEKET